MDNTIEDLSSCIEKCSIDDKLPFYYDSRFGTKIDEKILHSQYIKNSHHSAASIAVIIGHVHYDNIYILSILSNDTLNDIEVTYYSYDKTFVVNGYDPIEIIQFILKNYSIDNHPYYDTNYVPKYNEAPAYKNRIKIEYSKESNSRVNEPDESDSPKYEQPEYKNYSSINDDNILSECDSDNNDSTDDEGIIFHNMNNMDKDEDEQDIDEQDIDEPDENENEKDENERI
jgi:hypothetical protein